MPKVKQLSPQIIQGYRERFVKGETIRGMADADGIPVSTLWKALDFTNNPLTEEESTARDRAVFETVRHKNLSRKVQEVQTILRRLPRTYRKMALQKAVDSWSSELSDAEGSQE